MRLWRRLLPLLVVGVLALGLMTPARAEFTTPALPEGTIIYDADDFALRYCDDVDWVAVGKPGSGAALIYKLSGIRDRLPVAGDAAASSPAQHEIAAMKAQLAAQSQAITLLTAQRDALGADIAALKELTAYPERTSTPLKILTLLVLAAVALLAVPYLRCRA